MKNLAFHSSLRCQMIILSILTTSLIYFSFKRLWECTNCRPTLSDIDECASADANKCDANAMCTNTEGSYVCRCVKGFQGDGYMCVGRLNILILPAAPRPLGAPLHFPDTAEERIVYWNIDYFIYKYICIYLDIFVLLHPVPDTIPGFFLLK